VHILEMNGESYRLKSSKQKRAAERLKQARGEGAKAPAF
jgi:hypothetical protein